MDRNYMVIFLLGAMIECPYGEPITSCPTIVLKKKLTAKQFFGYVRSLTDAELITLFEQHSACINGRNDFINLCDKELQA
jgi:hypothetical protein